MPRRNTKKKMGDRQVRKLIYYATYVKWKCIWKEWGRRKDLLTRQFTQSENVYEKKEEEKRLLHEKMGNPF
jgi:hypothetical protein